MNKVYYETIKEINISGINISFQTVHGGYHPPHWHDELELLYPLNGETSIKIDEKIYHLPKKQLMVIESCHVHSTYSPNTTCMFLCVHVSKKQMQQYMPDVEFYQIHCCPEDISDEDFPAYLEICKMMESLTCLYIEDVSAFQMEAEGIILQVLAHLIRNFSTSEAPELTSPDALTMERVKSVITYVEEHFREPVSLTDISDYLGLGKEYFCRFFKKSTGTSFLNYLNRVRLTHIYQDLIHTDAPVAEIMEANGITNQKLFNRTFKELYGCTPSAARKMENAQPDNLPS